MGSVENNQDSSNTTVASAPQPDLPILSSYYVGDTSPRARRFMAWRRNQNRVGEQSSDCLTAENVSANARPMPWANASFAKAECLNFCREIKPAKLTPKKMKTNAPFITTMLAKGWLPTVIL